MGIGSAQTLASHPFLCTYKDAGRSAIGVREFEHVRYERLLELGALKGGQIILDAWSSGPGSAWGL